MTRMENGSILKRAAVTALGVFLGSSLISGISYDEPATLFWAVLVLSLISAFVRPVLVLFALPFVVLTLGMGLLVINAFLYLLVGNLVGGFEVAGFWPAFGGALVISILNVLFSGWMSSEPQTKSSSKPDTRAKRRSAPLRSRKAKDDVIDI
ncbi:phage holin family protein [Puniceicoccaceae bacterium K14]|nr:phage holin family protein [Puniceicoccaceae bacterium K14]